MALVDYLLLGHYSASLTAQRGGDSLVHGSDEFVVSSLSLTPLCTEIVRPSSRG